MYYYYPSCNFQRQFPETARKIRAYLETQADIAIASCCHVTNQLPAAGDVIVTVCMSCMRVLMELRPDCEVISLFELLLTREGFDWPDLKDEQYVLQDCFRARGRHGLHDAVRACIGKCGAGIVELPENLDAADFDGAFLLHDVYPQNIQEAPAYFRDYLPPFVTPLSEEKRPEYFLKNARRYGKNKVVCYCNTCTSGANAGGADARHLAELLFP